MKILPLGEVLKTDAEGYLISQSSVKKIVSLWLEAVNEIKKVYLERFGNKIHSIYVRGSVARGRAIESFSDIDIITVFLEDINISDCSWAKAIQIKFEKDYPFAGAIGQDFILYDDILSLDDNRQGIAFSYAFTIKVQSAHIYGQDLSNMLPKFKPNKTTALYLLADLKIIFNQAKDAILNNTDRDSVASWCRWVMKVIIRNAFLLIMDKEQIFTRDLYPCYKLFSKYFPQQKKKMKQALGYAINPIGDIHIIVDFLEDFGAWLQKEIDKEFLNMTSCK